ncbi:unnamed protein product [Blepharisma stoltei]|uniref:Uncharacterized protein n=1 Tax=Blepharisma stoltei TaxID=1481888 RepID=A0AAU9J281_9CILI|nr:unnamed protein product [Blepharisma stoltei]
MVISFLLVVLLESAYGVMQDLFVAYLSKNEYLTLNLNDFFEGEDLTFSVGEANFTSENLQIFDPVSFNASNSIEYAGLRGPAVQETPNQRKITSFRSENKMIMFGFYQNYIEIYSLMLTSGELTLHWNQSLEYQHMDPNILQVALFTNDNSKFAVILLGQLEEVDGQNVTRNDLYVMNVTDIENPGLPVLLDLWDIRYTSSLKISSEIQSTSIIPISGIFSASFASHNGMLFIYNFSDPFDPVLIQTISRYFTLPNADKLIPYPIDSLIFDGLIYMLDTNIGVILYELNSANGFFFEEAYFDLTRFGDSLSIEYKENDYETDNVITVGTERGLIAFSPNQFDEVFWVSSYDMYGVISPIKSSEHALNYFFLDVIGENNTSLMVVSDRTPLAQDVLLHMDIEDLVGGNFDPNGMWKIFYGYFGLFFYVRFDIDAITSYSFTLDYWKLRVTPGPLSYPDSYYAEIIAETTVGPYLKLSKSIVVYGIPENMSSILYIDGYSPIPIQALQLDVEFNGFYSELSATPLDYFSGPNLNFSLQINSIPSDFSFNYSTYEKINYLQSVPMNMALTSVQLIEVEIFLYTDSGIYTFYYGETEPALWLSLMNPISTVICPQGWLVYSLPTPDSPFINLIADGTNSTIQTWSPMTNCDIFFAYEDYMICGGSQLLDLYKTNSPSSLYYKMVQVSSELFQTDLYIIDATVTSPSESFPDSYLYILDKFNGVHIIDLNFIYNGEIPILPYSIDKNNVINAVRIIGTQEQIYIVFSDGTVDAYTTTLVFIRRISGKYTGIYYSTQNIENLLFIHIGDRVAVLDGLQTTHSSLISYIPINESCQFDVSSEFDMYWGMIGTLCTANFSQSLSFYGSNCPTMPYDEPCELYIYGGINITSPASASQAQYIANLTLVASNEVSSIFLPVLLNIFPDGENIWINEQLWNISQQLVIDYDIETILDFSGFYQGQNVKSYLNINGKYPTFNYQGPNYVPAIKWPQMILTDHYEGDYDETFTDHTVIKNTNRVIVTSSIQGLLIFNLTDIPNQEGMDSPDIPIEHILNVSDYINGTNPVCSVIEGVGTQGDFTLFVTACQYQMTEEFSWNEEKTVNLTLTQFALVLWEYDFVHCHVNRTKILLVEFYPAWLKVIPSDNYDFMLLSIDTADKADYENYRNNHVIRISGHWDSHTLDLIQVEIIDFHSLGLPAFYASAVDGVYSSNDLFLYVADHWYGIRILQTQNDNVNEISAIVGGLPMKDGDYIVSVGVCGNFLFTGTVGTKIHQFLLNSKSSPSIMTRFYPYNNTLNEYIGLTSLIVCSDYYQPDFIASSIRSSRNELYIRIYNTKVSQANSIMYDMPISPQLLPYSTGSVEFLNSYTVTAIGALTPWLRSYVLKKPEIIIPRMTPNEYQEMMKIWGIDTFELFITLINENMALNTTPICLRRTIPGSNDNDEGFQYNYNDNSWWIWLILGSCIFIILILACIMARYFLKKSKRPPVENERPLFLTNFSDFENDEYFD